MRGRRDKVVDPHFSRLKATAKGKPNEELDDVTWISGKIMDVVTDSYEHDGKTVPTVKITMIDGDEKYILDSSYTSMLRTLLTCIANIEDPGVIKISLYTSKDGYPSVWVEHLGDKTGFKWDWESTKDMVTTYKDQDGEEQNSYKQLNEFYAKQVDEFIGAKFRNSYTPTASDNVKDLPVPESEGNGEPQDLPVVEEEGDDLPF